LFYRKSRFWSYVFLFSMDLGLI